MKTVEILKEELQKSGVEVAEEVLESLVVVLFEKALPRIVIEEENSTIKSVAGVVAMLYPTLKPVLAHATDLNRDGI